MISVSTSDFKLLHLKKQFPYKSRFFKYALYALFANKSTIINSKL